MKVKRKTTNCVTVEFSTKEYDAFVELLKYKDTLIKDYKGGK